MVEVLEGRFHTLQKETARALVDANRAKASYEAAVKRQEEAEELWNVAKLKRRRELGSPAHS